MIRQLLQFTFHAVLPPCSLQPWHSGAMLHAREQQKANDAMEGPLLDSWTPKTSLDGSHNEMAVEQICQGQKVTLAIPRYGYLLKSDGLGSWMMDLPGGAGQPWLFILLLSKLGASIRSCMVGSMCCDIDLHGKGCRGVTRAHGNYNACQEQKWRATHEIMLYLLLGLLDDDGMAP